MIVAIATTVCAGLAAFFAVSGLANIGTAVFERGQSATLLSDFGRIPVLSQVMRVFMPLARRLGQPVEAMLQEKIVFAGQPARLNAIEFIAAVMTASFLSWLMLLVSASLLSGPSGLLVFGTLLAAGLVGAICYFLLSAGANDRQRAIERQMPYFLDLAVMATEAGSSLAETMSIFAAEQPGHPLSQEFHSLMREIDLGSTYAEALESLQLRLRSPQMRTIVSAIIQGQKLGTPIAQVMRAQSGDVRFVRTKTAEQISEELKVKILGPTMLMMMAIFLIILGPAFIETLKSGIF